WLRGFAWPPLVRSPALLQHHVSAGALGGPAISRTVVDPIEERLEIGPAGVQTCARDSGFERIAHLNVGRRKGVSCKPTRLSQLGLQEIQMLLEFGFNELSLYAACDGSSDRSGKERHGGVLNPIENQFQE